MLGCTDKHGTITSDSIQSIVDKKLEEFGDCFEKKLKELDDIFQSVEERQGRIEQNSSWVQLYLNFTRLYFSMLQVIRN